MKKNFFQKIRYKIFIIKKNKIKKVPVYAQAPFLLGLNFKKMVGEEFPQPLLTEKGEKSIKRALFGPRKISARAPGLLLIEQPTCGT